MSILKRVVTAPLYLLAATIVLLEDWLWDDLQRLAAAIGRLPVFHQFEAFVVRLSPRASLSLFIVPSLLLIPVKLVALWFISTGHALVGLTAIVLAKIAGTALVARLFKLTKPKLLSFKWFFALYVRITEFKRRIYGHIESTTVYKSLHSFSTRMREHWRRFKRRRESWLTRRWRALRHLHRRR
jgi:hypothetical protein